jgi:hypothetical protein
MKNAKYPGKRRNKRWYDKHDGLADALETLREAKKRDRDNLLDKMKELITKEDPHLIDKCCEKFPLNPFKRRWYDRDPYLWLVINSLRYTDDETIKKVVTSLAEHDPEG